LPAGVVEAGLLAVGERARVPAPLGDGLLAEAGEPVELRLALAALIGNQAIDIVPAIRFGFEFIQRLRGIQLRSEEQLIGMMDFPHTLFAESSTLKPDSINPVSMSPAL